MSEHYSLGTLVAFPLMLLTIVGLLYGAHRLRRYSKVAGRFDSTDARVASIACFVLAVLFIVGTAVGMYPYGSDYHKWKPVNGTVAKVESRLVNDGESSTERYVIQFTDGRERACDDTRCTLVVPGDTLHLSCKRHYQWASTPGWDCNFVKRVAK